MATGRQVYSSMPLDALKLSTRSYNALKRHGMETIGQLMDMKISELAEVVNLGASSMGDIIDSAADMDVLRRIEKLEERMDNLTKPYWPHREGA